MQILKFALSLTLVLALGACASLTSADDGKYVLFDGSSLEGWKSNEEKPNVFTVTKEGELKVSGGRAHLFWAGKEDVPADFTNFEFEAMVKTTKGSNSGLFFHTKYQQRGWPRHGYEAQVNTSHGDKRKTASIYAVKDVNHNAPSKDDIWFHYIIRVEGKKVTILVDGKVVNEYTEPDTRKHKTIRLSSGTFAIQGHDPRSVTYYKDIKVKAL